MLYNVPRVQRGWRGQGRGLESRVGVNCQLQWPTGDQTSEDEGSRPIDRANLPVTMTYDVDQSLFQRAIGIGLNYDGSCSFQTISLDDLNILRGYSIEISPVIIFTIGTKFSPFFTFLHSISDIVFNYFPTCYDLM